MILDFINLRVIFFYYDRLGNGWGFFWFVVRDFYCIFLWIWYKRILWILLLLGDRILCWDFGLLFVVLCVFVVCMLLLCRGFVLSLCCFYVVVELYVVL